MRHALIRAGLAISVALAVSTAWASAPDLAAKLRASATSGDIVQQRKDVEQVTRSPPPSGPSSQTTVCNPSLPDC